jgi:hypothetical protein
MQGRRHGSPVVVAAATLGPFLSPICRDRVAWEAEEAEEVDDELVAP